jgi:Asp-tRNA(Asn)/Glu-tRNA(Gln) amidotransferase C subunit
VIDLGNVANNMIYYLDALSAAADEMNKTTIDATGLADSIEEAANLLDVATKSLAGPAATLTTQIDGIVEQVERLVSAEAQIREIGGEIADVVQQPRDDVQQPNEMRNVEKLNEAIEAVVEVNQDNTEIIGLLSKIATLLENQAKDKDREGFFQNEGETQPDGVKFKEAGINL